MTCFKVINSALQISQWSFWKGPNVYSGRRLLSSICNDRDPTPIFFNQNVQDILKRLTGLNFEKIFRRKLTEKHLEVPKYEFVTEEELQMKMEEAKIKAESLLQMPPVLLARKPVNQVLSRDYALQGLDKAKYIFTDITFGLPDKKRIILVRDPDGILRQASWEERDRMNQIYNPRPGCKYLIPKMFLENNLLEILERGNYEFVLDRACCQFEPDDPEYLRVTHSTYEAIELHRNYESLHSTRHYGPLCFYLVWENKIDNLLMDLIQRERLQNSVDLIQLYHVIHPSCKSLQTNISHGNHLDFIKAYVDNDSQRRPNLQLALQSYQELLREREQLKNSIGQAHYA